MNVVSGAREQQALSSDGGYENCMAHSMFPVNSGRQAQLALSTSPRHSIHTNRSPLQDQKAGTSLIMNFFWARNDVSSQGHSNSAYVYDPDDINAKWTSPAPPSAHSCPRNLPAGNDWLYVVNIASDSDSPPPSEHSSSTDDSSETGALRVCNRSGSSDTQSQSSISSSDLPASLTSSDTQSQSSISSSDPPASLTSSGWTDDSHGPSGFPLLSALQLGVRPTNHSQALPNSPDTTAADFLQSDHALSAHFSHGWYHDGENSSRDKEPAKLFADGTVHFTRDLFPGRLHPPDQITGNPVTTKQNEAVLVEAEQDRASVKPRISRRHSRPNTLNAEEGEGVPTAAHTEPFTGNPRNNHKQSQTFTTAGLQVALKNFSWTKKCFSVCIPVSIVFVVCAIVAGIIAFFTVPSTTNQFSATANVEVRVADEFQRDMANTSSPVAELYGRMFCYHVTEGLKKQTEFEEVNNCTVNNLSNGSIVVNFDIDVETDHNLKKEDFLQSLRKSGRAEGPYIDFGAIRMFSSSVKVLSIHTVKQQEEVLDEKVPAEFDCSIGDAVFKPLSDTYPANCGHFQLCKDGQGTRFRCDPGLEFAYEDGSSRAPCRQKSNATYCGRKRLEDDALVTTVSTTTTVTTSEASRESMTTSTTVAPTTIGAACASLDRRILYNASSLYTCDDTNEYIFRPRNDTFPDNCGNYLECIDGMVFLRECAKGAHFVLGTPAKACFSKGDTDTFCQQMRLAQMCRDIGQDRG